MERIFTNNFLLYFVCIIYTSICTYMESEKMIAIRRQNTYARILVICKWVGNIDEEWSQNDENGGRGISLESIKKNSSSKIKIA